MLTETTPPSLKTYIGWIVSLALLRPGPAILIRNASGSTFAAFVVAVMSTIVSVGFGLLTYEFDPRGWEILESDRPIFVAIPLALIILLGAAAFSWFLAIEVSRTLLRTPAHHAEPTKERTRKYETPIRAEIFRLTAFTMPVGVLAGLLRPEHGIGFLVLYTVLTLYWFLVQAQAFRNAYAISLLKSVFINVVASSVSILATVVIACTLLIPFVLAPLLEAPARG